MVSMLFSSDMIMQSVQIYDRLTQSKADGTIEPRLADSWTVNDASDTITFHLNESAVWSDGEPVTAANFEYSWKRATDSA